MRVDNLTCPNCSTLTNELMSCEICNTIGCAKCMMIFNRKLVCNKCRTGENIQTQNNLFSMFD